MKQMLRFCVLLGLVGPLTLFSSHAQQAPSEATNIRITTDEQTKRLVILYDLPQVQPSDSLYVEIETASGRRFRPITVSGNVGKTLTPGRNKIIYWDVVRDNVQLDEEVEVIIRVVRQGRVAVATTGPAPSVTAAAPLKTTPTNAPVVAAPQKSALPVIGWVATGGLAIYAFTLSSGLNKDVDAYNQKTVASTLAEWNNAEDKRKAIDSRQGTFTVVAGATAALAVANVVWLIVRKSKVRSRTAWQFVPGSQAVRVGFVRSF